MDYNKLKQSIGTFAAQMVTSGMTVGLGTGTTAHAFIKALIERYNNEKLEIECVATSINSENLAKSGGLPLLYDPLSIDCTFDGADWITPKKLVVKGLGGALLREKIVAFASKKLVLMVDHRKITQTLAGKLLPIEIIPFAFSATIQHIEKLGCSGKLRDNFTTDNHNLIFDVQIPSHIPIEELDRQISSIPGVVETGLFKGFSPTVVVGNEDGSIGTI